MEEILKIVKETKDLLIDIDCANFKQKVSNQKKISKAYELLEKMEVMLNG